MYGKSRVFGIAGASLLLGLLAGCSGQGEASRSAVAVAAGAPAPAASIPVGGATRAVRQVAFAGLPDRGELLDYADRRDVRQRGAYTWYPVNLSEDHALRAIATGEMRLRAPDGRTIALKYERHIEHPDGNWSWIGRTADGRDAVLTFGETAAFGSIPNGDGLPLRLTMQGGRSYLVEVDGSRIANINIEATRPTRTDSLKPPLAPRLRVVTPFTTAAAQMAAADPNATPVVDVAVGYTNGFATSVGGQSAAVTRINNLVDTTNQAYANSQVNARVRLVHTMQVTYADATDNNVALEDLTGYRNGSSIPVPAALQPLRAARETYGADLVSLVRDFRTPENQGCGVAWILGFQQQPIDQSWSDFGYSVVSDGSDYDETDKSNYYCRDETFAHELGHNMGSAHDRETSKGDNGVLDPDEYGRYPYSFGHKTSVGNFFTVMAYGDSGQTSYRVFSNPRITTCGGNACGVTGQADNAQSLSLTTPIIATFRDAVQTDAPAAHNDVDGDGRSDVLLQRPGSLAYWIMNGKTITRSRSFAVTGDWRVVGTGDMDGNGKLDVLWMNSARQLYLWRGDGTSFTSQFVVQMASGYVVAGTGDVDADGKDDILLYRAGQLVQWSMNGATITRSRTYAVEAGLAAVAVGDFNGDGVVDVMMRNSLGDFYKWLGSAAGGDYTKSFVIRVGTNYTVTGAQDINADGKSDLILFRPGQFVQLLMGTNITSRSYSLSTSYVPVTTGAFDGAGPGDLILQHTANRSLYLWLGTATAYTSTALPTPASGYTVVR